MVAISTATTSGHSLALKADGTVWAWGLNIYGSLGDGTEVIRSVPVQIVELTGVVSISTYGYHSIALKSDGTVWAWGRNVYGQLWDGTLTDRFSPVQVPALEDVRSISTAICHSLALKSDGTVWGWGSNQYTQLEADPKKSSILTPVQEKLFSPLRSRKSKRGPVKWGPFRTICGDRKRGIFSGR